MGWFLQDALEKLDVHTRVLSAINIPQLAEPFIRRRAIRHLRNRGSSFSRPARAIPISRPLGGCAEALEIKADVILKATKVEGIYDADPMTNPGRRKIRLHYLSGGFGAATSGNGRVGNLFVHDNDLPIVVFNMRKSGISPVSLWEIKPSGQESASKDLKKYLVIVNG